ncbi:MAG: DNA replication/repair protein RecF [Lachnospiraceae bacterium]|nr:DNA replication/repair protein RecF [Lachnospiraceae bacterium]
MLIEMMELSHYRNYDTLKIDFSPGTNILYGDNAQGKTNALEAVYVCCTTKSHRGSKDREIIQFDQEESHIKLQVKKDGVPYRIDMHLKKNRTKGIAVNGIPIRKASQLFGIVNVIFFSPEDLNIIKNSPSERRRFMDMELCQLNKLYVHSLIHYNKVVLQRNKLLKDLPYHPGYEAMLDVWDEQLVSFGSQVIKERRQFVQSLNEIIGKIHGELTGEKEALELRYEPNIEPEAFMASVKKGREQELKQKTTLTGPHRDDMVFLIDHIDIRKFGSQGQQRSAALSLKLAEIVLVQRLTHDPPVLLLDDVLSELDSSRQNHLLDNIHHIQTILTCTGLDDLIEHRFQMDKIFKVVDGKIYKEN